MQRDDRGDRQLADECEQVELVVVELVGWLVEQQFARFLRERTGDLHSLALAAGKRPPRLRQPVLEIHLSDRVGDRVVVVVGGAPGPPPPVRYAPAPDDLEDSDVEVGGGLLLDDRQAAGNLAGTGACCSAPASPATLTALPIVPGNSANTCDGGCCAPAAGEVGSVADAAPTNAACADDCLPAAPADIGAIPSDASASAGSARTGYADGGGSPGAARTISEQLQSREDDCCSRDR